MKVSYKDIALIIVLYASILCVSCYLAAFVISRVAMAILVAVLS